MEQAELRTYEFQAVVERFIGVGSSFSVEFPFSVPDEFGTKGLVRVCGFMNGVPIERSLMPRGNGGHFLLLSHKLCTLARVQTGQTATFKLQHDQRIRAAQIPEELEAAFEMEPDAHAVFKNLPPGKQRDICTYIGEAKRPETREQRMMKMLNRLLSGFFKAAKNTRTSVAE